MLRQIVLDDTDELALKKVEMYNDGSDVVAVAHMAGNYEIDKLGTSSAAAAAQLTAHKSAAITNGLLAGSPATVARQLNEIAAVQGTGGILMSFDDYHETVDRFGAEVVPLLDFDLTEH